VSALAAASRADLLRRSGGSVHTDVYVPQHLSARLPSSGVAEPRNRGLLASSCPGSDTACRAGGARGAAVRERAPSSARCSVVQRVWRRLGFCAQPLLPAGHRGARHASRGRRRAARRRQVPELPRRVRDRPGDRRPNRSSIVVFRLASVEARAGPAREVSATRAPRGSRRRAAVPRRRRGTPRSPRCGRARGRGSSRASRTPRARSRPCAPRRTGRR